MMLWIDQYLYILDGIAFTYRSFSLSLSLLFFLPSHPSPVVQVMVMMPNDACD
jgi:hypothetical protein